MKKNLLNMMILILMLALALTALPAAAFTFGSSTSAQEEPAQTTEPAAPEASETAEEPAEEPAEDSAEELPAEPAEEETEAEPEEELQADTPAGFAEPLETLAPRLEEIFSKASKWTKKNAPQTLAEFPVLPADYQGVYEWMTGKTASFSETDAAYTVEAETPSFLKMSGDAVAYFKDMSTLPMTAAGKNVYSADKAGNAAHQAAEFWRIDMGSVPYSLKTDEGILWDSAVSLSIASSGLFGPAGSTDEIRFDMHRTGEMIQSIVWYIRSNELTVDIYYGNGNEVCRELTYDIKTGKLVSSEEW